MTLHIIIVTIIIIIIIIRSSSSNSNSNGNIIISNSNSNIIRGVPGFATDYPCGVWCSGLTIYLLYVSPLFGNLVESDSRFLI